MPATGSVIANKYELRHLLGRGSMGEVWVAHHRTLGEDVALKLVTSTPSGEVEEASVATARFRFEAQIAARLSRKTRHIVRVTDHGEEDGLAYLVMELLEGETLERGLMRRGCLSLGEASKLVAQVARALTEAHAAEVMHRDLKPANIFLTRDEDGGLLVKLLDFGIARTTQTHRVPATFATGRGFVFGTPGYMSPEQASPSLRADHRCDLWALATVAYEVLTLELPVTGEYLQEVFSNLCAGRIVPVHERNSGLPSGLAGFFARAFAPQVKDRYASASELAQAFDRAIAPDVHVSERAPAPGTLRGQTLPITFPMRFRRRPEPSAGRSGPTRRTRRVLVALAATMLSLAAMATAGRAISSWTTRPASPPRASAFQLVRPAADSATPGPAPIVSLVLEEPAAPVPAGEPAKASDASASFLSVQARPVVSQAHAPKPLIAPPTGTAPASQGTTSTAASPAKAPTPAVPSSARRPMARSEVL
jgi:eukaryotic-like serine/threonine-protein kinase